ncbi:MAG: hypothetical protein H0V43_04345 [Gemmatimonadales bacterium]|nr:hypothetical protein [Gemmatimonadales bacterium]MBA3553758.1 hypothetical protein [Gemmatimonadales bacterium]
MKQLALSLLLVGGVACSGRPAATTADSAGTPAPRTAALDSGSAPAVTLERTPCYGTCPVYQLSISRDGTVRFVGKQHVARQGAATASIPPAVVDSLVSELEAGGYFGFDERYLRGAPGCGRYATDSPTVITSLTADGRSREIRHDHGCHAAPPELARLERRIDEVAGTARWTGN